MSAVETDESVERLRAALAETVPTARVCLETDARGVTAWGVSHHAKDAVLVYRAFFLTATADLPMTRCFERWDADVEIGACDHEPVWV